MNFQLSSVIGPSLLVTTTANGIMSSAAVPNTFLSTDDILAGTTLLLIAFLGIVLHMLEVMAMCKLVKTIIGFRFFIVLSIADLGMLFLFGIVPGAIVFVPSLLQPLTAWKRSLHIIADTVWFACCYMNVLIAISRFACVVFPLHFRLLRRQSTCWLIGASMWAIAVAQSWAINSIPWFVPVWYEAGTYGMSCDWVAYAESGTRKIYLTLNGMVITACLLIYTSTALIIFTKKPVRFRFFNAVLKPKCSGNGGQAPPNDHKLNVNIVDDPRRASCEILNHPKNAQGVLQRRSVSNNNILLRTVNILRSVRSTETSHSMEVRLVIPCCVNALIFIVGQCLIINGGIGPQGKWADLSVMLIFCLQSIAPPILRLLFSKVLRQQFKALLSRAKCPTKNDIPEKFAMAQQQKHQQQQQQNQQKNRIWIEAAAKGRQKF